MASRSTFPIESLERCPVMIAGSFKPNSTSALVASETKGKGFTAARSGVGTFTITCDDTFPDLLSVIATLRLNTVGDQYVQPVSFASKVLTLKIVDASSGAAVDIAHNANNVVSFMCMFKNAS